MLDDPAGTMYPCLYYDDAMAAIDWLERAFGFQRRLVVPGDESRPVAHAELALGMGCVMLSSSMPQHGWVSPDRLAGTNQSTCIYLPEVDSVYESALAAGAKVIFAIEDTDYGSRGFTVRDPEGHDWNFGTYRTGTEWNG